MGQTAQELQRCQSHFLLFVAMRVGSPAQGDLFAIEAEQAMIADGYTMGVTAEVAQHLSRSAEGRFSIDDPVFLKQPVQKDSEALWMPKLCRGTCKAQFSFAMELP